MSYSKEEPFASYDEGHVPPSYTEYNHTSAPAPGDEAAVAEPSTGAGAGARSKFPPALNGYLHKKLSEVTFHLSENGDTPLFYGELHSGWSGKPEVTLRSGPSENDPVMATAGAASKWTLKNVAIAVASSLGAGDARPEGGQDEMIQIDMASHYRLKKIYLNFAMDVGPGGELRREEFEWRHSSGGEIQSLDGDSVGWKLVRLSEGSSAGGKGHARPAGLTSDGKEIVAVWAHNASLSMTKAFKFQFLGSGLTGVLGDRWAAAALVSAVRMWWVDYQSRAATAANS
ncbi:hypothetical protein F5X99DRAFT_370312 [Biscogniauxia marginata]|nr:hypothetical protein F5X99DRAFT_370312 [Biscogniauxia marginata]